VAELLGIFLAHCRVLFQQKGGLEQQVVKIHRVGLPQELLVTGVNAFDNLVTVGLGRVFVRADEFILGA